MIDLSNPTLFGNDVAEDETEGIFHSYFLERNELARFGDADRKLLVVRAYKGEGKSALLRAAEKRVVDRNPQCIVVRNSSGVNAVNPKGDTAEEWVHEWKVALLRTIAAEVGRTLNFAWTDDQMTLVEEAIRSGTRGRTFLGAILDRVKIGAGGVTFSSNPVSQSEIEGTLSRVEKHPIWLFYDDVDLNFDNKPQSRARIAGFFTACRQLVNSIPGLVIRATIRPNIWTLVRREAEAMSHVEQYMVDLQWQTLDIRNLLSKRISAYLDRRNLSEVRGADTRQNYEERLIAMAFDAEMIWGRTGLNLPRLRPPHVVLGTLSRGRPRWLVELCKQAAEMAVKRDAERISVRDIDQCLAGFGRLRMNDLVVEFRSECPDLEKVLAAFTKQAPYFRTDELLTLLKNRILNGNDIKLAGSSMRARPLQLAHFLFQIGFITARMDYKDSEDYEHFSFADNPELLTNPSEPDHGFTWEVHPVFRQVLLLETTQGQRRVGRSRGG